MRRATPFHRRRERDMTRIAKLDERKVMVILRSDQRTEELASMYGVTRETIRNVRSRKTWRHVA